MNTQSNPREYMIATFKRMAAATANQSDEVIGAAIDAFIDASQAIFAGEEQGWNAASDDSINALTEPAALIEEFDRDSPSDLMAFAAVLLEETKG